MFHFVNGNGRLDVPVGTMGGMYVYTISGMPVPGYWDPLEELARDLRAGKFVIPRERVMRGDRYWSKACWFAGLARMVPPCDAREASGPLPLETPPSAPLLPRRTPRSRIAARRQLRPVRSRPGRKVAA